MAENKNQDVVIEVNNLTKTFLVGDNKIRALRDVDLKIYDTDFVIIFGPSGCGKSTLLNIILGIDQPTSGKVTVRNTDVFKLPEDERAYFRLSKIGMVHQMPYWIKSLTVRENVAIPLIIKGIKEKNALERADAIMEELSIGELANQKPTQLSGGQQQKVGLARALITNPWIIMADEPTGNLDSKSADEIMKILSDLSKKHKRTVILVTHNDKYWEYGNRRIEMIDGKIAKDTNHTNHE